MLSSTAHGMGPGLWKVLGDASLGGSRMGPEANQGQSLHPSVSDEVINEKGCLQTLKCWASDGASVCVFVQALRCVCLRVRMCSS